MAGRPFSSRQRIPAHAQENNVAIATMITNDIERVIFGIPNFPPGRRPRWRVDGELDVRGPGFGDSTIGTRVQVGFFGTVDGGEETFGDIIDRRGNRLSRRTRNNLITNIRQALDQVEETYENAMERIANEEELDEDGVTWDRYNFVIFVRRPARGGGIPSEGYEKTIYGSISLLMNKAESLIPLKITIEGLKCHEGNDCGLICIEPNATPERCKELRTLIFPEEIGDCMTRRLTCDDLSKLIKPLNLLIHYYCKNRSSNFQVITPDVKYYLGEVEPIGPPKIVKMYLDGDHWSIVKSEPQRCEEGPRQLFIDNQGMQQPRVFIDECTAFDKVSDQLSQCIMSGHSLMISGSAGTGKSHLVMERVKSMIDGGIVEPSNWAFCAHTGVASKRINSDDIPSGTLSSKFRLCRLNDDDRGATEAQVQKSIKLIKGAKGANADWYKHLKFIFIDEVFAVPAGISGYLDRVLKGVKENEKPYGGVQLIMSGDPGQLPPVNALPWQTSEAFLALSMHESNSHLSYARLTKIYRATDPMFQGFCERLRVGRLTSDDEEWIHSNGYKNVSIACDARGWNESDVTVLTYKNNSAHNNKMSEELLRGAPLAGEVNTIFSLYTGNKVSKIPMTQGFRVMLTKNTSYGVNGSVGTVTGWDHDTGNPFVLMDGTDEPVEIHQYHMKTGHKRVLYDNDEDEEEVLPPGVQPKSKPVKYYTPLILAWSITFHKCQGLTLTGKIIIDAASIQFVDENQGLLYVATTRATDPANVAFQLGHNNRLLPCAWDNPLDQHFDNWLASRTIGDPIPDYLHLRVSRQNKYINRFSVMADYKESDVYAQDNGRVLTFVQRRHRSTTENDVYFDLETHPGSEKEGYRFKTWMCTMLHHHTCNNNKLYGSIGADQLGVDQCEQCNHKMEFTEDRSPCDAASMDKVGNTFDPEIKSKDSVTYKCWTTLDKHVKNPLDEFVTYLFNFFEMNRAKVISQHPFVHGSGGVCNSGPMNVYAFNGAAFDTLLLFNYMMETWEPKGYELSILPRGTTLISMLVTKVVPDIGEFGGGGKKRKRVKVMEFKDLRLIVGGGSLRGAVKSYVGRKSLKSYWPHDWLNADNMEKMINLAPEEYVESITVDHFPNEFKCDLKAGVPEATRIMNALKDNTYNAAQEARTYGCMDTLELARLGFAFNKMIVKHSKTNMSNYLTASSYSKAQWLSLLPKKLLSSQTNAKQNQKMRFKTQLFYPRTELYNHLAKTVFGGKTVPRTFLWKSIDFEAMKLVHAGNPVELYKSVKDYIVYLDINGMYAKEEVGPTDPVPIQNTAALTTIARDKRRSEELKLEIAKSPKCNKYPCGKMIRVDADHNSEILGILRASMNKSLLWKKSMNRQTAHSKAAKAPGAKNRMGFVCCDFIDRTTNLESIICRKSKDGRNVWDTGVYKNQWISMVDYYTLMLAGATFSAIHQAILFQEAEPVFREFAMQCLKGKAECAAVGDMVGKAFKKLETNGTYGKSLEDSHKNMVCIVTDLPRPKAAYDLDPGHDYTDEELRVVQYTAEELDHATYTSLDRLEEDGWKLRGVLNYPEWASMKHHSLIVTCEKLRETEVKDRSSFKVWKQAEFSGETSTLSFKFSDIDTDRDPAKFTYEKTLLYLGSTLLAFTREHIYKILTCGNKYAYKSLHPFKVDEDGKPKIFGNGGMRRYKNTIHDERESCERLFGDKDLMSVEEWNLFMSVIYGDTDSFMVTSLTMWRLAKAGYLGDEPGQLGDEVKHLPQMRWEEEGMGKIVDHVTIGPKTYADRYILPSGEIKTKFALKGIPKSAITPWVVDNIIDILKTIVYIQQHDEMVIKLNSEWETFQFNYYTAMISAGKDGAAARSVTRMRSSLLQDVLGNRATFKWEQFTRIGIKPLNKSQERQGLAHATIHKKSAFRSLGKTVYTARDSIPVPDDIAEFWRPTVPLSYTGDREIFKEMSMKEFIRRRLTISRSVPDMDIIIKVLNGTMDLKDIPDPNSQHAQVSTEQAILDAWTFTVKQNTITLTEGAIRSQREDEQEKDASAPDPKRQCI